MLCLGETTFVSSEVSVK